MKDHKRKRARNKALVYPSQLSGLNLKPNLVMLSLIELELEKGWWSTWSVHPVLLIYVAPYNESELCIYTRQMKEIKRRREKSVGKKLGKQNTRLPNKLIHLSPLITNLLTNLLFAIFIFYTPCQVGSAKDILNTQLRKNEVVLRNRHNFGEYISKLSLGMHIQRFDDTSFHVILDIVAINLNVLGSFMEHRVGCDVQSCLIVTPQSSKR